MFLIFIFRLEIFIAICSSLNSQAPPDFLLAHRARTVFQREAFRASVSSAQICRWRPIHVLLDIFRSVWEGVHSILDWIFSTEDFIARSSFGCWHWFSLVEVPIHLSLGFLYHCAFRSPLPGVCSDPCTGVFFPLEVLICVVGHVPDFC
jgi:hypothetical protein